MKLKYYLRGLGIGVVVTAIIMSIVKKPETLTDAQIKMRALELGMVEESVLADLKTENNNQAKDSVEDVLENQEVETDGEQTELQEELEMQDTEVALQENSVEDAQLSQEEIIVDENSKKEEGSINGDSDVELEKVTEEAANETVEESINNNIEEVIENYIIISVEKGNGSEIVSQRLFEAGLVNSKDQFNRFLVQNGYDRKLKVGNHEIPAGATEEEMAKILCNMK